MATRSRDHATHSGLDKSARPDGKFSRTDFVFDRERNVYVCPAGKLLTHAGGVDQGRILAYRASRRDCTACELKPRCTTAVARKVSRDIDEDIREQVRALANTEAFQQSRRERKKIEMRFAHMKRILSIAFDCEVSEAPEMRYFSLQRHKT